MKEICESEALFYGKKGRFFRKIFWDFTEWIKHAYRDIGRHYNLYHSCLYPDLKSTILADPFVITGDVAMAAKVSNGVFIGTCIGAFIGTFLCAVYAKVPLAQAPGMGLNAFFAYTVVLEWVIPITRH